MRLAIRSLLATPVISFAAILSLALGIGANTVLFSMVNGLVLRDLPVSEPDRLASVSSDAALKSGFTSGAGVSAAVWTRFRDRASSFDGAFAWYVPQVGLGERGQRQPIDAIVASGSLFDTLGVRPLRGRLLQQSDDVRGGGPDGPVAVISERLWRRTFAQRPDVVGLPLFVEGVPFKVVGVLPPSFFGLEVGKHIDVVLPLYTEPLYRGPRALVDSPHAFLLSMVVRLRPGQSLEDGTDGLRAIQPELLEGLGIPRFAEAPFTLTSASAGVEGPASARPRYQQPLVTILAVAGVVLLVACTNIAHLLSAKAQARRHEFAVQRSLGATRWQMVRPRLLDSGLLSVCGAVIGLGFASWCSIALIALLPVDLNTAIDLKVLAFAASLTVLTTVIAGIGPALGAARVDVACLLRQQAAAAPNRWNRLVMVQIALSLTLVVTAGLLTVTFGRLSRTPLGFDSTSVLLVTLDLSHHQPAERADRVASLLETLTGVVGVRSASASFSTPTNTGMQVNVRAPGSGDGTERRALANAVTPDWFRTYRTPLRTGRDFESSDRADGLPVAIVNTALADQLFIGTNALEQVIAGRTIVGIVENQIVQGGYTPTGALRSIRSEAPPTLYVPMAQAARFGVPDRSHFVLNIAVDRGGPMSFAPTVAATITSSEPGAAFGFRSLETEVNGALAQERVTAILAAFFGALALLLAAIGLFGVAAFSVVRRRTELGIRFALGASPRRVRYEVVRRAAVDLIGGIGAGLVLSWWMARYLGTLLFGIGPYDATVFASAAVLLGVVGIAAAWIPAERAARLDPTVVLRSS